MKGGVVMKRLGKKFHEMRETIEAYCLCFASCPDCSCTCAGCPNPKLYPDVSQWYSPMMQAHPALEEEQLRANELPNA